MAQHLVCRLCLESIPDYCEDIAGIKEDLLKFSVTEIDLNLSSDPKMCKRCSENLRSCYEFKSVCLESNETLEESVKVKDDASSTVKKEENCETCRLCLMEKTIFETLDTTNGEGFVKEMVEQCLPELNFSEGAICEACFESLKNCYAFLNYCIHTEEKIKTYCEIRGTDTKSQVDLYEVYEFTHHSFENTGNVRTSKENDNLEHSYAVLMEVDSNFETKFHINENYVIPNETSSTKLEYNAKDSYEDGVPHESENAEIHDEGLAMKTDSPTAALPMHELEQDNLTSSKEPLHLKKGEFMCDMCGFVTQRKIYLHKHVKNRHEQAPEMFKCKLCSYQSRRNGDLIKHLSTHKNAELPAGEGEVNATNSTSKNLLRCKVCPYKTKEKQYLIIHNRIHEKEALYTCKICSHVTKTKSRLGAHMHVHRDRSELPTFTCALCCFQTTRKVYLHKHVKNRHEEHPEMIKCKFCPYRSKRNSDLAKHLSTHRNVELPADEGKVDPTNATSNNLFTCKVCAYQTSEGQYLIIHNMSHKKEVFYACTICSHVAKTKSTLSAHMHVHRDRAELPTLMCGLCFFQTTREVYMHKHMRNMHGNSASIIMHKCTKCNYSTKCKEDLVKHLICHEKSILCDHCSFRTNYTGSIKSHLRKMHNIEPGQ